MSYLTFLTITPILIAWIISQYKAIFVYRYFIVSALLSYVIIACGILSFKRNLTKFILVSLIILMSVHSLNNYYRAVFPLKVSPQWGISAREDYRSLARFLANNFQPGDIICHNSIYTIPSLEYYLVDRLPSLNKFEIKEGLTTEARQKRYLLFTGRNVDTFCLTNKVDLIYISASKFSLLKKLSFREINFNRLWSVSHCEEEEKQIINWVNNNFKKDKEIDFHALKLFLYLNPRG